MRKPKSNAKFDMLTNIGVAHCDKHGEHSEWSCRIRKDNAKQIYCRLCQKDYRAKEKLEKPPNFRFEYTKKYLSTESGLINHVFKQAKGRANKKGIPFTITKEWVHNTIKNQDYKCAYSGIPFDMSKYNGEVKIKRRSIFIPSLDQIVPVLGYTEDNTAIVTAIVNSMKLDIPIEDFVSICKSISEYNIELSCA